MSAQRPKPPSKGQAEPFAELKQFDIHPESVRLLNPNYCHKKHVVVLGKVDPSTQDPVKVGMLDTANEALTKHLEGLLGRPVVPVRLNAFEIERALQVGLGKTSAEDSFRLALRPVDDVSFDPKASMVQVLNEILGRAAHLQATDIHIETYEDDIDVRFRLDGLLQHMNTPLDRRNIGAAVSRLKILAGLDITERRRAQDGRIIAAFESDGRKRNIDFRLSVLPGPFGEDAVLRLLDSAKPTIGLEKLGMPASILTRLVELVSNPEGLVVVTGPTGSGKTTTLYSALQRVRVAEKKILTVEDPIEYSFEKINQKAITDGMGFADYARAFMRQNPDIIMIGEIRDEETAEAAFRAAQTGHLVLSTLHTNDAVRTVSRLRTLGVDANLMAGSLLGALSQRLVRKICEQCREEAPADERERRLLALPADARFSRGRGCDACGGQGYRGRLGLYEMFVPDEELADLIAGEGATHEIRRRARDKGMRSLLDDGFDKARAGVTSLSEILRVVPYRIIAGERSLQAT